MTRALQQYATTKHTLIKAIHTGRRVLGLDDPTYRDLLHNAVGHDSCAGLSVPQLRRVLDVMRSRGFAPQPRQGGPIRKVFACWYALADAGKVQDRSRRALDAYSRRICGTGLDELTPVQLSHLIETLKQWQGRA